MVVKNWHWGKDKNGKQKKIYTEEVKEEYRYAEYIDQSPDAISLDFLKYTRVVRLDFDTYLRYSSQASQSKKCQEYELKQRGKHDENYDFVTNCHLDGIIPNVTVYNSDKGLPFYCNSSVFLFFALFMQSWIIRVLFVFNSQRVQYDFQKYIVK